MFATNRTTFFTALASLVCLLNVFGSDARCGELVIPSGLENVEGNSNNQFPFGLGVSYRYQQVYEASDFGLSDPVLIKEIRFRPDGAVGNSFSAILPDVQINLSTTSTAPDGLSSTFADNVGTDVTIVHDGALSLSSADTGPGPRDFDIVITFSTPFLYDPSAGNLLLDVRNFGGGDNTTAFDAENTDGDPTSRATTSHITGDVNSPIATLEDSRGLVTKIVFESSETPIISVAIDVKPGSDENVVKLKSNSKGKGKGKSAASGGAVPVAILTTDDFDATTTDIASVALGDPDLAGVASPMKSTVADVDNDGDDDLLLHFSIMELVALSAIDEQSVMLLLTGEDQNGNGIAGMDFITVKP